MSWLNMSESKYQIFEYEYKCQTAGKPSLQEFDNRERVPCPANARILSQPGVLIKVQA